jgi:hypothetical protein
MPPPTPRVGIPSLLLKTERSTNGPGHEDEEEDEGRDERAAVGGRQEAQQREDERRERHQQQLHAWQSQKAIPPGQNTSVGQRRPDPVT